MAWLALALAALVWRGVCGIGRLFHCNRKG